jgi:hypothetical protein
LPETQKLEVQVIDPATLGLATALLSAITGLAGATKSWLEARKAKEDLDRAREEAARKTYTAQDGETSTTEQDRRAVQTLVIDPELLQAMTKEMEEARAEYAAVVRDPSSTPDQIDQATAKAVKTICRHLRIVKERNNQVLPEGELQRLWKSYQCERPQPRIVGDQY